MPEYYRNGWYTPLTKRIDKNAKDIKDLDGDVDVLSGKVEALESEVPDPPEVNGSYILNVIVSDNGAVIGWAIDRLPVVAQADSGKYLIVNADGKWAATTVEDRLPVVTQADEGKFLVVNSSGVWAATTIPSAETNSF